MIFKDINKEFIFENNNRLFNCCHASTIILLSNGDKLSAWFGGTREGSGDVAIWCSKRKNENGQWTNPLKVADKDGVPHWNPVLFQSLDGIVYMFYKVGHTIRDWSTMIITSYDCGNTWTSPKEMIEGDKGGRGPVRNKPIILSDGTWLAPASTEKECWEAFVDISHDQGISWERSSIVPVEYDTNHNEDDKSDIPVTEESFKGRGVIQPTLWESEPGIAHMLLRSTEGCIYRSDSYDGGKTWSLAYITSLPNNNSGIDITKLTNGSLALVYNPVDKNWGARTPLVLSVSCDNGITWKDKFVLEDGDGEYSYPAIISKGNEIFLTYTWRRKRIAYWEIAIE